MEEALAAATPWLVGGCTVTFTGSASPDATYPEVWHAPSMEGLKKVHYVHISWTEDAAQVRPGGSVWRPGSPRRVKGLPFGTPAEQLRAVHKGPYTPEDWMTCFGKGRLFSVATRRYLRRRAWRYFRNLGKRQPERYRRAALTALKRYTDEDVADGLALLDNWGLVHILFHHCPALESRPSGWRLAPGRRLAELAPAPTYPDAWLAAPRALVELVREARCRPVRQWAIRLVREHHHAVLAELSPEELAAWLSHSDPMLVGLAADVLGKLPDLSALGVERLLGLLDDPHPDTVEILCDLLRRGLRPEVVTLERAADLARRRPLPVARLGFAWLQAKAPAGADDCRALLELAEAEAEPLRPGLVRWARAVLGPAPGFQPDWVLEFLDSRHADVRAEGWRWLLADPRVRDDVAVWQKLLESPYDDVRLPLVAALEGRIAGAPALSLDAGRLDTEQVRLLWATVLLNIHRGGRSKPAVVSQVVRRLQGHAYEAPLLVPLLAVALRSVRGPEWRAGLVGLTRVVVSHPEMRPVVERAFPELKFGV
jgi:hypothetical protein